MRPDRLSWILFASVLACSAAHAASGCAKAAATYPAADQPSATQRGSLGKCDASRAYYGIGIPVDYVSARLCAYATDDFSVLMMVYANAQGVPRNYPVARKAACDADGAPAETSGRLEHLAAMESGKNGKRPVIDFCDDITSGMMMGVCSSISEALAAQQRQRQLDLVTRHWPAPHKAALLVLQAKFDAFVERAGGEVDQSGTARAMLVIEAQAELRQAHLDLIKQADAKKLKGDWSPANAAKLDQQLNTIWKKLKDTPDADRSGTVRFADILAAQRAWLAYRDAWTSFARQRFPELPEQAWQVRLTKERITALEALRE